MAGRGEDGEPLKLREKAYDAFKQHLLARDILPGQFVSQRELVELTGLPLGAIRELVPRLEAEGLIRTVPQRGMQVAHIDVPLIRDAFQFRVFIEKEAMALFVESASDAVVSALVEGHRSVLQRALSQEVTPALVAEAQAVDWGFHDSVVDALGNEIVSKAYRVNDQIVAPVMQEHLRIMEALERRDAPAAVAALVAHINRARDRALGLEIRG
jgi:DNA-binding GntR family transcriptional regulator